MIGVMMITTPRFLALAISLATADAIASDKALEEVHVTAQQREQNAMDVALSINSVDAQDIEDYDINTLEELTQYVPGLNINGGATQPNLFVRGVGSGLNIGFEQSVGLFVDDVYLARAHFVRVPLTMDVEQVEFIYGPQGSMLGKNSVAGALNIHPVLPDQRKEASLTLLYEPEHKERSINATLAGALSDTLSGRAAVHFRQMDGWWHNAQLNSDGPEVDNIALRTSLRWQLDTTEVRLKLEHGDLETGHTPFVVYQSGADSNFQGANPFPIISDHDQGADDQETRETSDYQLASLHIIHRLEGMQFSAITGYAAYDSWRIDSVDFSPQPALHRIRTERYSQLSQEFRLQSSGEQSIQWLGGLYIQQQTLEAHRRTIESDFLLLGDLSTPAIIEPNDASTVGDFDQDTLAFSAYARAEIPLTETLSLNAGLRYSIDDKEASKTQTSEGSRARLVFESFNLPDILVYTDAQGALIDSLRSHHFPDLALNEDHLNWDLALRWQQDNLMLYASANTAYKSGGFDEAYGGPGNSVALADPLSGALTGGSLDTSVSAARVSYDSETVLSFEVGAKWQFNEGRSEIYGAVFHSRYDDLQTSALDVDEFVVVNAGKAISEGIEAGGRFLVGDHWTIKGSLSALNARWDSFKNAPCTVAQTTDPANNPGCLDSNGEQISNPLQAVGQDLSGETLQFAPDFSANISLAYLRDIGNNIALFSRAAINHRGAYYSALDLEPETEHDAITTLGLSIGLSDTQYRWRVALVGKNLSDEKSTVVNAEVPTTASSTYFGIPQRGRSIALQLHFEL
jgi:outer membrane receptor protein involved in Fe transport